MISKKFVGWAKALFAVPTMIWWARKLRLTHLTTKKSLTAFLISLFFLSLTACTVLGPPKTDPINTYALTTKNSTTSALAKTAHNVLLVAPTDATPGYQNTNMVYTARPYELKNFARNRWIAPPADMFTTLLSQYLAANGCFRTVVTPPFTGNTDLTLQTRLLVLQQEFNENSSQVHMSIAMILLNNHTQQVSRHQRIDVTVPAAENTPYAGVVAANKATEIVLSKIKEAICKSRVG